MEVSNSYDGPVERCAEHLVMPTGRYSSVTTTIQPYWKQNLTFRPSYRPSDAEFRVASGRNDILLAAAIVQVAYEAAGLTPQRPLISGRLLGREPSGHSTTLLAGSAATVTLDRLEMFAYFTCMANLGSPFTLKRIVEFACQFSKLSGIQYAGITVHPKQASFYARFGFQQHGKPRKIEQVGGALGVDMVCPASLAICGEPFQCLHG